MINEQIPESEIDKLLNCINFLINIHSVINERIDYIREVRKNFIERMGGEQRSGKNKKPESRKNNTYNNSNNKIIFLENYRNPDHQRRHCRGRRIL